MRETSFSFSGLESPAPATPIPAGPHVLRGWVWPKPGGHFVDVRARVGERVFAGVHGFPRADLAAHFQTGRPVALAEFQVIVELSAAQSEVALETLTLDGRWTEFDRVRFAIDPAAAPITGWMPGPPTLRWHELGRMLQLLLRAQRRDSHLPLAELARRLAAEVPMPRDLRFPHLPFHGHLDEPAAFARSVFGRIPLIGFLFHETKRIRRVLATYDLQGWQSIEHTRASPNLVEHFPRFPHAAACFLLGFVDAPAQLPDPLCLRLYAELEDGSLHLCSAQRCQRFTSEEEKSPYPPRDAADVDASFAALHAALTARGLKCITDEPDWALELARIRGDFATRAPRSLPRVAPLQAAPVARTAPLPRRALLVTHNLNFEGAPLFFVDYAQHLAAQGVALTIASPSDGPLRGRFEACGATIKLVDVAGVFAAVDTAGTRAAIAAATTEIAFSDYDVVVCNTFTTFWAVHAAKAADRPVIFYVHESTTPTSFYGGRISPAVVALADEAFGLADVVSFTTASTRSYHTDYGRPENHRLAPGWIDVARIDAWLAANPRDALRARFNLRPGELLVTNVGTVCDRKGQHIFARAVDLLWRRDPELAARTRFVMLGGGDLLFDQMLADLMTNLGRPNLEVHRGTPDYFPYYAAADLFVCSTYEESSPRVILETMACGTSLLSCGVHGVPEQVRPGWEATLIPPGDTVAMCDAMIRLLRQPEPARVMAARARARVVAEFDSAVLLPRHAALAAEVAAHAR